MFLWTKRSPGFAATTTLSGTRLSAHPIHKTFGVWPFEPFWKKSGSTWNTAFLHSSLAAWSCESTGCWEAIVVSRRGRSAEEWVAAPRPRSREVAMRDWTWLIFSFCWRVSRGSKARPCLFRATTALAERPAKTDNGTRIIRGGKSSSCIRRRSGVRHHLARLQPARPQ